MPHALNFSLQKSVQSDLPIQHLKMEIEFKHALCIVYQNNMTDVCYLVNRVAFPLEFN